MPKQPPEEWPQISLFPIYRLKKTGDEYLTLRAAAAHVDTLTPTPDHALVRRPGDDPKQLKRLSATYAARAKTLEAGTYTRSTLFDEIVAAPRTPWDSIRQLMPRDCGRAEAPDDMVSRSLDTLIEFIGASWNPKARHVMLHSSGYDTRLIAAILHRLARERGEEWLGEVRFAAFAPEIGYARKIWAYLDWPAETWMPVYPAKAGRDYYAPCLDFATAGRWLSEAERFWGGPFLAELALRAYLRSDDKPLQGITALFSDETLKWNRLKWGTVGWFQACFLFDNPGILPGTPQCRFLLPFASPGWLKLLTAYHVPMQIDDFKLAMITKLDKSLADLDRFPNFRFSIRPIRERNLARLRTRYGQVDATRGHIDEQWISPMTARKMEADYASSWYAKNVGPARLGFDKDPVFRYWGDKNTHYLKAAIYEHLLAGGRP